MSVKVFTPAELAAAIAPPKTSSAPKLNVVAAPTPGQDSLCCAIFSINGALQSMNLYCRDENALYKAMGDIVGRRNSHIRHEDTRIVEMWFGVTPEFAQEKANEIKAANKNGTLASDIFDDSSRILSTAVTEEPENYNYF